MLHLSQPENNKKKIPPFGGIFLYRFYRNFKGFCNVFEFHAWLVSRLFRNKRNVDETCFGIGIFVMMQNGIYEVVANVGSGGIGNRRCDSGIGYGFGHFSDRQGGEICVFALFDNRNILWLIAFVIGNGSEAEIYGNHFRGDTGSSSCLTDADDCIGREVFGNWL